MSVHIFQFGQPRDRALGARCDNLPDGHSGVHHGPEPEAETDSRLQMASAPDQAGHAGSRIDNRSTILFNDEA